MRLALQSPVMANYLKAMRCTLELNCCFKIFEIKYFSFAPLEVDKEFNFQIRLQNSV